MNDAKITDGDEIDLVELFKTLWGYKFIILGVTLLFGILGFLYAFVLATPKYQVSAIFENGYIKTSINDKTSIINGLKFQYIDKLKDKSGLDFSFDKIEDIKNSNNFKIDILANSNEIGISKMKEVLENLQKNEQKFLDNYIEKTKKKIELNDEKLSILNARKVSIEENINSIKSAIANFDNQIFDLSKNNNSNIDINSKFEFSRLIEVKNSINQELSILNKNLTELTAEIFNTQSMQIELKNQILPANMHKTSFIGDILIYENPVKPKKVLICVIAIVVGSMVGVFAVLIKSVMRNYN
ncbi:MAG: Wzz/FepE/Etk N-terminal domain-containing protein [Campylobacter sputorum]|uniref:Wzz/FepE/Etk N-terminal domain-containing protein n=1 Tax=Campylobacter sputorum TaxID=206 RepID=UPI002A90C293|nr:Wzz/FepE/Etk N-terminal domain-containing protein [Campylobacter sputorum]MDY6120928.1 Wzz/FepE/Etk N-terminal domain-containing protein [Campylobacter sputorum]